MASAVLTSQPRNSPAFGHQNSMKKSRHHASNGYTADRMAPERSFTQETHADFPNVRSFRPLSSTAPCVAQNFTTSAEPLSETASEDSFTLKRKSSCLNDGKSKAKESVASAFAISVSVLSRLEKRRLRKRIKVELQQLRSLSLKLETREREIRSLNHSSRSTTNDGATVNGCYIPAPAESRQSRQLSSTFRESQVESNISLEKSKRIPKAVTDSDYGMPKGKVVPVEKQKSGNNFSAKKAGSLRAVNTTPVAAEFNILGTSKGRKIIAEVLRQCGLILNRLMNHKFGWVFNEPVDVVKLNLHDYLTIIKRPMDLGTVKKNLDCGIYQLPNEFRDDVRLTFSNAMKYNPKGHDVYHMADTLRSMFESKWKAVEDRLNDLRQEMLGGPHEGRTKDPGMDRMKDQTQDRVTKDRSQDRTPNDGNQDRTMNYRSHEKMANGRSQDRVMKDRSQDRTPNDRTQPRAMQDRSQHRMNTDRMTNDRIPDRTVNDRSQDKIMADRMPSDRSQDRMVNERSQDRVMTDRSQDRMNHRSQDRFSEPRHEKVKDLSQDKTREQGQDNSYGARDLSEGHVKQRHPTTMSAGHLSCITPVPSKKSKPPPNARSVSKPNPAAAALPALPRKRDMTYSEKQQLSECLGELPPDKLEQVVQIMRKNGNLMQNDEEIEVDIEAFDPETLWDLHHFVIECNLKKKQEKQPVQLPKSPQLSNDAPKPDPSSQRDEGPGEEDVDIDDDSPVKEFPPVVIEKDKCTGQKGATSSSSSSGSGSSSSDSDSGSSSGSDSEADDGNSAGLVNKTSTVEKS